jgi:hypothetical protein
LATSRSKKLSVAPIERIEAIISEESIDRNKGIETERQEEEFFDTEAKKALSNERIKTTVLNNVLLEKEIENLTQNMSERKSYARRIFVFTLVWGFLIFLVIFSCATKKFIVWFNVGFELSDKVIITLITSTTINFFVFFLLVVKYLFNTEANKMKKEKKKYK